MTTVDAFLAASATLTGFREEELQKTGLVGSYLLLIAGSVGDQPLQGLVETVAAAPDLSLLLAAAERDPELAVLARAVAHLWFTGVWSPPSGLGQPSLASPQGYSQGLVWRSFGAVPPGTAGPGHGSWSSPPRPVGRGIPAGSR
ncbi:hypothetical protein [Streptacidiphilus sp. MAP5-3]|uniref:hypothetical protein n=1 Tax=unclassified Streptacidiphilus TaxID=2643834 RepID=UPI003515D1D1